MNSLSPPHSTRRRITVVGATIACLLLAEWAIRAHRPSLSAYTVSHFNRKIGAVRSRPSPGILLLGSSRAYFALVPEEFEAITGRPTFNLGVACSKVVEWRVLAEQLLPDLRPQLTVLGVNAGEFRADYVPTYAARYLFTLDDLVGYVREHGWSSPVCGYYLRQRLGPLWAGYDLRFETRLWAQEQLAPWLPKYAQQARELREFLAPPCPFDGYEHPWLKGCSLRTVRGERVDNVAGDVISCWPDAQSFTQFDRLLAWFKQHQLPLIVTYLPNCPRQEARWSRAEPPAVEWIAAMCTRHGVPFLPCPMSEIARTDADYVDESHAGLPLARRLSRRIAGLAVSIGAIDPAGPGLARGPGAEGSP